MSSPERRPRDRSHLSLGRTLVVLVTVVAAIAFHFQVALGWRDIAHLPQDVGGTAAFAAIFLVAGVALIYDAAPRPSAWREALKAGLAALVVLVLAVASAVETWS